MRAQVFPAATPGDKRTQVAGLLAAPITASQPRVQAVDCCTDTAQVCTCNTEIWKHRRRNEPSQHKVLVVVGNHASPALSVRDTCTSAQPTGQQAWLPYRYCAVTAW